MSAFHAAHAAHRFLESTKVGHEITKGAVNATVSVAQVIGGTTLAGVALGLAPVTIPTILVIGTGFLASGLKGKKH